MSFIRFVLVFVSSLFIASQLLAEGNFEDLGPQLNSTTIQGTTFAKDPHGKDLVCTVIRGEPAKLLVFDASDGTLRERMPLENGAHGAWNAATASDGNVYIGTDDNGHLYRWTPGEKTVKDLGLIDKDQTFVWDEAPGEDGEVFAGTYPGCLVMAYTPKHGFRNVCNGPATPGENYARSVTYDPESGKVYVGVGAHARLIEVDPKTGEKQDILPTEYASKQFVYTVRVVAGKLFALLTPGNQCLIMDPKTRQIEHVLFDVPAQLVISEKSPYDDRVYFKGDNQLRWYDLKSKQTGVTDVPGAGLINGVRWMEDGNLLMLTQRGNLIRFDPSTGKSTTIKLEVPPEETMIQSIARGPDGKIYCGGYLSGGLSVYDPKSGEHKQFNGISQSESMAVLGDRLFCGVYPHARLYSIATTQPWDPGHDNPRKLDQLDRVGQDRPMSSLGVERLNKVFFGTVPEYGTLGGTLSIYDAATDKIDVHRNFVPDQSIIGLAYTKDLVIGSTTRSGGLGIEPKAEEAKLFGFDPKTNEKVFEMTPVPKAWLITGLVVGPDQNVWGVGDETLFLFDVTKRQVIFSRHLFPSNDNTRHAHWRDAFMTMDPKTHLIYGTMGGQLFRLDPQSREVTPLRENGVSVLLARDLDGRIYFRSDRTHLWRYTPPAN